MTYRRKLMHLGYYDTEEEAAMVAKRKRIELGFHGETPLIKETP